jgi:tRNA threonylcarbamoyladenosine biosynthesis protein TsaE
MGSGKTTFIKSICTHLGVKDAMSSPTFSIINEYTTDDNRKIYHFDFYRIKNEAEAYDIGSEEYFYSGDICLIEWPEKIPTLIPPQHVEVSIAVENPNQRTIALSVHDGKEKKRI